jgi:dGTP triphosphohydrolase
MAIDKDTLLGALTQLADPAKMQAELDKLSKARDEALAAVNLVGPANEILNLRTEAFKASMAAQEEEQKTKSTCADLLVAAKQEAQKIASEAEAELKSMKDAALAELAELKEEASNIASVSASVKAEAEVILAKAKDIKDEGEAEVKKLWDEAKAHWDSAVDVKTEAEAAKAKFEAAYKVVMDHVASLTEKLNG